MTDEMERVLDELAILLVYFKSQVSSLEGNTIEHKTLKTVPHLSKSQIWDARKSHFSVAAVLHTIGFVFSIAPEDLTTLKNSVEAGNAVTDEFCFVVFFHVISLCYLTPQKCTPDAFILAMECLTLCVGEKYRNPCDMCFYSLLQAAQSSSSFEWDKSCVSVVFAHVMADAHLTSRNYESIVKVCAIAVEMGDEFVDKVFTLLIKAYRENLPLVQVDKPASMVNFLMRFLKVLDTRALAVLTLMSQTSNYRGFVTVFGNLPIFLGERIAEYELVFAAPKMAAESAREVPRVGDRNDEFEFVEKQFVSFPDGLLALSEDLLMACSCPSEQLPEPVQKTIMSLAGFLTSASDFCACAFFDGFQRFLKNNRTHERFFDWYCAFLFLLGKCNGKMKEQYYSVVVDDRIFDSSISIFENYQIDHTINAMRTKALSLLDDKMWERYFQSIKDSLMMFVESLGRVLYQKKCLFQIANGKLLNDVWRASLILQDMDLNGGDEIVRRARSTLFLVIFDLTLLDGFDMFSTEASTKAYFRFLFEEDLQEYILANFVRCVKETTETKHIISLFLRIIGKAKSCVKHLQLAEKILASVNKILAVKPKMIVSFQQVFNPVLNIVSLDNCTLTKDVLSLLYFISRYDMMFQLPHHVLEKLASVIPPRRDFFPLLQQLLGSKSCPFVIEHGCFIPLICRVYADSEFVGDLIDLFVTLSSYSIHNRLQLHQGKVDSLMLKLLPSSTALREKLGNFLMEIGSDFSDFDVTTTFIRFLISSDYKELNVLTSMIKRCTVNHSKVYELGSINSFYEAILPDDCGFNDGFIFNFSLRVDLPLLMRTNVNMTIMSITDANMNQLSLFVRQAELYCQMRQRATTTMVCIFDGLENDKWQTIELTFTPAEPDIFNILVETKSQFESAAQIRRIPFTGPLKLELGRCRTRVPDHLANITMGFITSIYFADKQNVSLLQDANDSCWKENTLHRNMIDCLAANPRTLRKLLTHGNLSDDLVFCLKEVFSRDPRAQSQFRCDAKFIDRIKKSKIDFHLYLILYSVFNVITDDMLKIEWMERIMVNIWIWIMCSFDETAKILNHWNTVLKQNVDVFRSKAYFSEFLTQIGLFFPFANEKPQNITCNDYTPEEKDRLRSIFVSFVKRVASVKLVSSDVINLLTFCSASANPDAKTCYLEIVRDCAEFIIAEKPQGVDIVRTIACCLHSKYPSVVAMALQALHELNVRYVHHFALATACQSEKLKNPSDVLDYLIPFLPKYPNLVSFASLLGLEIPNANILTASVSAALSSPSFVALDFWYLMPLLLSAKLEKSNQWQIMDAIVTVLAFESDFRQCITPLFHFFSFLTWNTDLDLAFYFLRSVIDKVAMMDNVLMQECFLNCARTIFFHISTRTHSRALLIEFGSSPFELPREFVDCIARPYPPGFHVDLLDHLNVDLSTLRMNYGLRLDDVGAWMDEDKAKRALTIGLYLDANNKEIQDVRNAISYFAKKSQMTVEQRLAVLNKMEGLFKDLRRAYKDEFLKANAVAIPSLQKYLSSVSNEIGRLAEFEAAHIPNPAVIVEINTTEILNKSRFMNCVKVSPRWVHDHCLCSMLCPVKIKERRHPYDCRCMSFKIPHSCELPCSHIRGESVESSSLRIGGSELVLLSFVSMKEHIILFEEIKYLLERGKHCLEIFTDLGRSFYLDFSPDQAESVISRIPAKKLTGLRNDELSIETLKKSFRKGKLSNFEFAMKMNIACGRSFSLTQTYPMFPTILSVFDDLSHVKNLAIVEHMENELPFEFLKGRSHRTLKDLVCDAVSVAPEFFCYFESSLPEQQLPKWAANSYEFIYQHRKLFEKPSIQQMLPTWIEMAFGVSCRPPIMVDDPEPRQIQLSTNGQTVLFAEVVDEEDSLFVVVLSDGQILFVEDSGDAPTVVASYKDNLSERSVYHVFNQRLHIFNPIRRLLTKFSATVKIEKEPLLLETTFWAQNGRNFVCCETRSALRINKNYFFTESGVYAFCASFEFGIVVLAVHGGSVVIVSMKNHRKVKSIDIEGQHVLEIVVTPALGFVVVLTRDCVWILNVNGTLLRKTERVGGMHMFHPFRASDGLDYVAFVDSNEKIGYFEPFYPENVITNMCECCNPISLYFSQRSNSIIVCQADGLIHFVPVSLL